MPNDQLDPGLIQSLKSAFAQPQAPQSPQGSGLYQALLSLVGNQQPQPTPTPSQTPQQAPVNPYTNLANKATGQDFK